MADRLTSTETGLHTWLVLWDGPASHAVTCLRWRRCASDARFETWETQKKWPACRLAGWICVQDALARHISLHVLFCFLVRAGVYFDFFWCVLPERVSQNFFLKEAYRWDVFFPLKQRPEIFALYTCYRWWFYFRASLVLLGICSFLFFPIHDSFIHRVSVVWFSPVWGLSWLNCLLLVPLLWRGSILSPFVFLHLPPSCHLPWASSQKVFVSKSALFP